MNNQGLVEVRVGLEARHEDVLRTYQSQGLSLVISYLIIFILVTTVCVHVYGSIYI